MKLLQLLHRNRGAFPERARGTGLFLLSPLDWALVESWKNAGVPLEAVLRGIDAAFEKWRSRKVKTQMVNSLAFCAQAVLAEAQVMAGAGAPAAGSQRRRRSRWRICALTSRPMRRHAARRTPRSAASLRKIWPPRPSSTTPTSKTLEQRLTVLEEKMIAAARSRQRTEESLLASRRELDRQLRPYRGKMTADQLSMLEKQYLERSLLEKAGLPRLSLFYMR